MKRLFALIFALAIFVFQASADEPPRSAPPTEKKLVALTFDDGPHTDYTLEILGILKEYGVKATFFVIGQNAEEHPEIVKAISDSGHEIGNHTYSHVYINRIGQSELKKQVTLTENVIEKITGSKPRVFRPPYGAYSDASVKTVTEMGYKCVLWSCDSKDWQRPPVSKIVSSVEKDAAAGDILLFHDYNLKNSPTPDALRELVPYLLSQGFHFVTVSELFEN